MQNYKIIEIINNEIAITKTITLNKNWGLDYKEGFIDGMKRIIELLDEFNLENELKTKPSQTKPNDKEIKK